jgi:polyisoprenoid-binding protein YceI
MFPRGNVLQRASAAGAACTALVAALMLGACVRPSAPSASVPSVPVPPGTVPSDPVPTVPVSPTARAIERAAVAGERFRVDPDSSLVTIRVFRGGALARIGHNHVIAARGLQGEVIVASDPAQSVVQLKFPLEAWTVDEAGLREAAGADFASEVPESAREGTRRNLLGDSLLQAAQHPEIELVSESVRFDGDTFEMTLRALVAGRETRVTLPGRLARDGVTITASGDVPLRQSDFGLQPFSVMGGALAVLDDMQVSYRIVARVVSTP